MCGLSSGSGAKLYPIATPQSDIPSGVIVMWSGVAAAIPSGWYLCDGQNGTPDLRNRFIVGAGSSYEVGNTGGSDSVTLTTEQMPSHSHSHSLSTKSSGLHSHTINGMTDPGVDSNDIETLKAQNRYAEYFGGTDPGLIQAGLSNGNAGVSTLWEMDISASAHTHSYSGDTNSTGSHTHSISGSISNTGGGQSHENRPPYYALCFIMKA